MSLETIKVLEPRVNIKSDVEKNHIVLQGGSRVTEQKHVADSAQVGAGTVPVQALWTIYPPSTSTITDRLMRVKCYVEVTTNVPHALGLHDAVRQFPINSIVDVTTIQVNGESISDNSGEKLHALLSYGMSQEERSRTVSTSASMPDTYQRYEDWQIYGSAKNPLSNFGENGAEDPRGGFPVEVISPTVFRVEVTEAIQMSPFYNGIGTQEEGFVNVNQFNIALRFKANLSSFMSCALRTPLPTPTNPAPTPVPEVTSVGVSFYKSPEILTTFITPDMTQPIPELQVLPYHKSQDYLRRVEDLIPGASTTVYSDSIKLSQIPRRLFLFVRHNKGDDNQNTANSFLKIKGLNILWGNQSGLLANASEQDLYEISRRNGCSLSYPSFSKYRGSVMCIEFGKDIGLLDDEAPGTQGQYTMQIQMTVENTGATDFLKGDFYQIFEMEGTFSIAENMARASLGNLTKSEVLSSKMSDELDYSTYENLQGGSFFSSLKNIVNKVSRGVQSAVPIASQIASVVAPELTPLIGAAGKAAGIGRALSGGRMSGGRIRRR